MSLRNPAPTGALWSPVDNNYLGATNDPQVASSNQAAMTAGVLYLSRVKISETGTIGNIRHVVGTSGSGLTTGQCFIGVYDTVVGNLIGTSTDRASVWASTGTKVTPIASNAGRSLAVYPGTSVYVGILQNGTTPSVIRGTTVGVATDNTTASLSSRFLTMGTGQTALPDALASIALGGGQWWFAVTA